MKYKELLESFPDGTVIINHSGEIEFINKQLEQLSGYSSDELMGRLIEALIPARFSDHKKHREAYLRNPQVRYMRERQTEMYMRRKDGTELPVSCSLSPLQTKAGMLILANICDITEHKQTEQALRMSEASFELATKGFNDGFWYWDVDSDKEWPSSRFYELLGYQDGEFETSYEHFLKLVHPDDKDRVKEAVRTHLDEQTPYDIEYRLQSKTGKYRWFNGCILVEWDDQGKAVRMAGANRDITEHRQAEIALRHFEHIVSSTTDMLAFIDKRCRYVVVNKVYAKVFGKTPEQLSGQAASDVLGQELFDRVIKPNAERCLAGERVNYQVWMDFPTYGQRYMDVTFFPYTDESNEIQGFLVDGRDIT